MFREINAEKEAVEVRIPRNSLVYGKEGGGSMIGRRLLLLRWLDRGHHGIDLGLGEYRSPIIARRNLNLNSVVCRIKQVKSHVVGRIGWIAKLEASYCA